MQGYVLLAWCLILCSLPQSEQLTKCGICDCSDDREILLCAGKGLSYVPNFPEDALHRTRVLGLQRNYIFVVDAERLNAFTHLRLVDVSSQRTAQGCVTIQGALRADIVLYGKFYLYI